MYLSSSINFTDHSPYPGKLISPSHRIPWSIPHHFIHLTGQGQWERTVKGILTTNIVRVPKRHEWRNHVTVCFQLYVQLCVTAPKFNLVLNRLESKEKLLDSPVTEFLVLRTYGRKRAVWARLNSGSLHESIGIANYSVIPRNLGLSDLSSVPPKYVRLQHQSRQITEHNQPTQVQNRSASK